MKSPKWKNAVASVIRLTGVASLSVLTLFGVLCSDDRRDSLDVGIVQAQAPVLSGAKSVGRLEIAGIVLEAESGNAISGARIELFQEVEFRLPNGFVGTDIKSVRALRSDETGHFGVPVPEFGNYRVEVKSDGYVPFVLDEPESSLWSQHFPNAPTQVLEDREELKHVEVRLVRPGVISGKIADKSGNPATNMTVAATLTAYDSVGRLMRDVNTAVRATTDDRGMFRLFGLAPGNYYVSAGVTSTGNPIAYSRFQQNFQWTYYPGVVKDEEAVVRRVRPGMETANTDFRMAPSDWKYNLSGLLIDSLTGRPPARADNLVLMACLLSGETAIAGRDSSGNRAKYDSSTGRFSYSGLMPASYGAFVPSLGTPTEPSIFLFSIDDHDIDDLVFTQPSGVSVPGRVVGAGPNAVDVSGVAIELWHATRCNGQIDNIRTKATAADGSFKIDNVTPDNYQVVVKNLNDNAYVESINWGHSPSENGELRFPGRADALEVILSAAGGEIAGSVLIKTPATKKQSDVVLVPDDRKRRDLYRTVKTDTRAAFVFHGVPPGDYELFSWESSERNAFFGNEFMVRWKGQGVPVHIEQSSRLSDVSVHQIRIGERGY